MVAAAAITSSLTLPTPTPTISEPTPAPTATPAPQTYTVRAGDTLFEIALANDLDLDELLAANNLSSDDVYTIQPGDELIIPDPNAAPPPTATSTATPVLGQTYTVRPGDTLMGIAQRFGISTQALMDANGLTISQARTLRSGQELIIPGASTAPEPTATPRPAATATAPPAASTAKIRLDAPILRTPENKTAVSCSASDALVWQPVPFIQSADIYVVHLGYVNGIDASGNEQIVWVIAQQRPANVTSWNLDNGLCGLASLEFGRQWRWYVDVAEKGPDGTLTPVSQPSEMWGFSWQ
ncbi:MAG: LysM peptidoglycan-binding domain-containing protein [Caldilineaceae bacterium]|nr:LysM peptidoglycan-binding domain-containing protein [Caldilineaceae bacterium]